MTGRIATVACLVFLPLLASACAPRERSASLAQWAVVDVQDEAAYPLGPYGGLQHSIRVSSSEGRTLRVRGQVYNPYANSVGGVRIVVQILASGEPDARELERHEIEFADIELDGGEDTAVSRNIQTMYTSTKAIRVAVFAIQRGGSTPPPPPTDLKGAQTVQLSTAGVPIPESMAGNFFSGF